MSVEQATGPNKTVKFKINEFETVAQVFAAHTTVEDVLRDVADKFRLKRRFLQVKQGSVTIPPDWRVGDLPTQGKHDYGIVEVDLLLSDLAVQYNSNVAFEGDRLRLDTDIYYR